MKRHPFDIIRKRIEEPKKFIQVIAGPRQVGKTTLVRQLMEIFQGESLYHSADAVPAANQNWIGQIWEIARIKASSGGKQVLLAFDEIQKIDGWSEMVKKCWDEDTFQSRDIRVILSGSSQLLIQKGLTESLAGRFELTRMGHWSFPEMETAFGLTADQYVWFGGYPGSAGLIEDETRWQDYIRNSLIETTLNRDIMLLTRVDKPALMRQLFELGCSYSGQIVALNKMLGTLNDAGNTTTLSGYLRLLGDAGLLSGLEKFSRNQIRLRASSPKFQVHNPALFAIQAGRLFSDAVSDRSFWGRAVESAVGSFLLNSSDEKGIRIFWWREGNAEIDFVLTKGEKVVAIEVKSGYEKSTGGMEIFRKKFNPDKILLVGNSGFPWQEFLKVDLDQLF